MLNFSVYLTIKWVFIPHKYRMFLQIDLATPTVIPADSLHQITHSIMEQAITNPSAFWHSFMQDAIHFGLKVLAALAIYLIGAWIIKRVKLLLTKLFHRRKTEKTLATFVTSFVSIMMTVVLVIISVSTLGVDTTSLAALLAAGGMAIGMALSGTVQNFAGGIMLLVFKPFQAGDFIEAQGYTGTVTEVSIVSTKILTTDNRVVVLPNGALSNGTINNFSAQPLRRVDVEVSVAYGSDADACEATILDIIKEQEFVLTSADERPKPSSVVAINLAAEPIPNPFVALKSLNANDITFVVRVWTHSEHYWDVYFALVKRLYSELPKRGFKFAYPHCDVTIVK